MTIIQKLPVALCNQIAAGEVIERPANVIKELLENSVDAGADSIHVSIEHGGLQKIEIRDNGIGISEESLPIALERYTTSKIRSFDDMYALHTFGFRGEALASIASISVLTIASALKKEDGSRAETAYITTHYGEIKEQGYMSPLDGTVITIENLFLNTPVRLKFLKPPATEQKRCIDIFLRFALVHLNIEFTLTIGNQKVYHFEKNQSLLERSHVLFPRELRENLIEFSSEYKGITVHGLCSAPHLSQKRADKLFFYVNNRYVSDKFLMRAVREGYKEYLTTREYPFGIFFIDIPPDEVDVNVHPTKSEVRFLEEVTCMKAIITSIRNALTYCSEEPMIPTSPPLPVQDYSSYRVSIPHNSSISQSPPDEHLWQVEETIIPTQKIQDTPSVYSAYHQVEEAQQYTIIPQEENILNEVQTEEKQTQERRVIEGIPTHEEDSTPLSRTLIEDYEFHGTIAETYLVYRERRTNELLIIDQHAAHERILEEYITRNASCNVQYLAPAISISLHPQEEERFLVIRDELITLGFMFKLSEGVLFIEAIPSYIPKDRVYTYMKNMLLDITDDVVAVIHKKACTNAIKKGDQLLPADAYALLQKWIAIPNNTHCPHGRPISIYLDKSSLERLFKRIV